MRGLLGLDGIASAVCSFTFLSQKLLLAYGDRRHERTNEHQRRRLRRRVKSDLGPGDSSLAGVAPQPTTLHATHSAHSTTWAAVAPLSHHGRAIQATRSILRGSSTLPPSSSTSRLLSCESRSAKDLRGSSLEARKRERRGSSLRLASP